MSGAWRGLARIAESRRVGADCHRLRLEAPDLARGARPGQFVHVLCPSPRSGPVGVPFLRRPLSVHDADAGGGTFELLFRVKGPGTKSLAEAPGGLPLDVIGPLGNGFPEPGRRAPAGQAASDQLPPAVVGGGIGVAPLLFLVRSLAAHGPVVVLIGLAGADELDLAGPFRELAQVDLRLATEDGSPGTTRGLVTVLLEAWLGEGGSRTVYACGPRPMLAAVWALAARARAEAWFSLEERMACAVGACRGCAVAVRGGGYRMVCRDGPVFPAGEIDWDRGVPGQ